MLPRRGNFYSGPLILDLTAGSARGSAVADGRPELRAGADRGGAMAAASKLAEVGRFCETVHQKRSQGHGEIEEKVELT